MREAGAHERERFEENTDMQTDASTVQVNDFCCEWSYEDGLGDGETANEGVGERGRVGEVVVREIVREEDAVGGVDAPSVPVDEEVAGHADPTVATVWRDVIVGFGGGGCWSGFDFESAIGVSVGVMECW